MECLNICGRNTLRDPESQIETFLPNFGANRRPSVLQERLEIIEVNSSLPAVFYNTQISTYDMNGDKQGYIFCHENYMNTVYFNYRQPPSRDGTRDDVNLLTETFAVFGFRFKIYYDMKKDQIIEILSRVIQQDHSRTSCLFVTIMTHATSNSLFAADKPYRLFEIDSLLQNANLAGIPKFLLLPHIRGGNESPGIIDRILPQPPQDESAFCGLPCNAAVNLWYGSNDWMHKFYNQVFNTECTECPICQANNVDDGNTVLCASGETIVLPSTSDFLYIHAANNDPNSMSKLIRAIYETVQEAQESKHEVQIPVIDLILVINQKVANNTDTTEGTSIPETRITLSQILCFTPTVNQGN